MNPNNLWNQLANTPPSNASGAPGAPPTVKTAGENTPPAAPSVEEALEKKAAEIRAANREAEKDHAVKLGELMARGFIEGLDSAAKARLAVGAEKLAADDAELGRLVRNDPAGALRLMQDMLGPQDAYAPAAKIAEDEAVAAHRKIASAWLDGYMVTQGMLAAAQEQHGTA